MTRRPYTTKCRFFSDSAEELNIVWYPCTEGAKDLGLDAAIYPLDFSQQPWVPLYPGEVWERYNRPYNGRQPIPGSGMGGVCGTPEDFANGIRFDDPRPLASYRTDGLPTCCAVPLRGVGGARAGGRGEGWVFSPTVVGGALFCGLATTPAVPPWWQCDLFPDPTVPQWFSTAGAPGVGQGFRLRAWSVDPAHLAFCQVRQSACTAGTEWFAGAVPALADGGIDMTFLPIAVDDYRVGFRSQALGSSPSVVFRFDPA